MAGLAPMVTHTSGGHENYRCVDFVVHNHV